MSRPTRNTDRLLLDAARRMVAEKGLSSLTLRGVARRAGVNLGMFHYHFKSKDEFVRRVLQQTYEDFFQRLSLESGGPGDAKTRLRRALTVVARFGRENRRLIMMLLGEVLQGNKACMDFAKANVPRHAAVVASLIEEGRRRRLLKPVPLPVALAFCMGGVGVPNAVVTLLERAGARRPFGRPMAVMEDLFLSDEAIAARVDLILSGLARRTT